MKRNRCRWFGVGLCCLCWWLVVACPTRSTFAATPAEWVEAHLTELVELYRHLHSHPELSFQEEQTAARIAEEFSRLEMQVTTGVGGHGVVALLANGEGPTLMLRADLDALPVTEQTGLVYASTVRTKNTDGTETGVMHACGHDIHMTNLIGVAHYLAEHRKDWSGTVVFVGQPAEERGAGASAMLEDGLFQRFPRPDFAVALHVNPAQPAGHVSYRSGYAMANVDSVDITVRGRGGHGAYPHTTIDPIVQAAQLVLALQTIVSRELQPIDPAVVTVGSIHGGTKHNVIGDSCHLQLTVRSYSDEVRTQLHAAIRRKAQAAAMSAGAPEPEIVISEGTPSLWNDRDLTARLVKVFRQALGDDHVEEADPSMGGEDFSQFGKQGVPILMFWLGAVDEQRLARYRQLEQPPPSLHSPLFYPDAEPTLKGGITAMVSAALELLPAKSK